METKTKIGLIVLVFIIVAMVIFVVSQANPVLDYCENQGNKLAIKEFNGTRTLYCVFPDGQGCNAMEFYQGECKWNPMNNPPMLKK